MHSFHLGLSCLFQLGCLSVNFVQCYGGSDGNHTPGTPARTDGSCHDLDPDPLHRLGVMRDALNSSGRPIFFSNEFPAASQNYPGNTYNASWMIETHANDMGSHANMCTFRLRNRLSVLMIISKQL